MLDLGFHSFRGLEEGDPIASLKEVLLRSGSKVGDSEVKSLI